MKTEALKNRYFDKVNIESLHQESKVWISGFDFWKDEVRFMRNLINKNFIHFVAKDRHHTLQPLLIKINEIENNNLHILKKKVIRHENRIAEFLKRGYKPDMKHFLIEHINILNEVERFQNNYRLLKTELFRMAEKVVKEKKIKSIVSGPAQ